MTIDRSFWWCTHVLAVKVLRMGACQDGFWSTSAYLW